MSKGLVHILKFNFVEPITSEDTVVTADLGGQPIQALMVEDVVMLLNDSEGLVPDIREHVPNIRKMKMDEDDVIICAFPKSGISIIMFSLTLH